MKIRTRYYISEQGHFTTGGDMVLEKRSIRRIGNQHFGENTRPFYFNQTLHSIVFYQNSKRVSVEANRLICDASYNRSQRDYLVRLNWFQRQKLAWMFRAHWLQQPGNMVHVTIVLIMITLAFAGFEWIQGKF
jgi:hypothetical protein